MQYLTEQHSASPSVIEHEGVNYPVTRLIELGDTATLAMLGVYPHVYLDPFTPAPLGTEWVYNDTEAQWEQVPLGTEEEKLAALKTQRKANLYQRRVQAEKSSFQHDGHWYDGSDDSIERFGVVAQQITWAIMAGVPMETTVIPNGWRDLDDVGGPSTIAELQAMLQSHYQHGVLCEQNSQALKAAINAATTMEELNAVDMEIGWPS